MIGQVGVRERARSLQGRGRGGKMHGDRRRGVCTEEAGMHTCLHLQATITFSTEVGSNLKLYL